jgi:uncharacterized protein Yka (UPF0111/DUF47 family)
MSLISLVANAIRRTRRPLSFAPCARNPFRRRPCSSGEFGPRMLALSRLLVEGAKLLLQALNDSCQRIRCLQELTLVGFVEDELAQHVLRTSSEGILTPAEQQDIRRLAAAFDAVLDVITDAGHILSRCAVTEMPASVLEAGAIILDQCERLSRATMLFRAPDLVCDECQAIYRLQVEAQSSVGREIATLDAGAKPSVTELFDLYVKLALASDAARQASRMLERIVVSGNDTTGGGNVWI